MLEELVDRLMIAHCKAQPKPQEAAKDLRDQLEYDAENDPHRLEAVADRFGLIASSIRT